jgi:hypothetical protein
MSEAVKENPKTPKRSKRKPAMEPVGWDEIVSQPGMGGYLSFLNGPVPLPHLQPPIPEASPTPEPITRPGVDPVATISQSDSTPAAVSGSEAVIIPVPVLAPEPDSKPDTDTATTLDIDTGVDMGLGPVPAVEATIITAPVLGPEPDSNTEFDLAPAPDTSPGADSVPRPAANPVSIHHHYSPIPGPAIIPGVGPIPGRIRIRTCVTAQDGHSLGEEVLYQALWKAAAPGEGDSRTIVIGWRGMSQLCRMTPKNCKINTQRLIRKLALEVLSPYNTPESIGTTYRVYSADTIVSRRRSAGLQWVVRSKGVEFVDPATGISHSAHVGGYVST